MPATLSPPRSTIATLLTGLVPKFLRGEVTEAGVIDAVRDLEAEPIRAALVAAVSAQEARKPYLATISRETEVKQQLAASKEAIAAGAREIAATASRTATAAASNVAKRSSGVTRT